MITLPGFVVFGTEFDLRNGTVLERGAGDRTERRDSCPGFFDLMTG